ncbi:Veg family protein, partial [Casaltella massiliensis]|nr:Veg family protein [Casaltella massiliensis]
MATVQTLNKIRQTLEKHLGRKILLKANKGRKQIVTKKGVLEKVYPSIF